MYCMILHGVPPVRYFSAPPQLPPSQKGSQKSSQKGPRATDKILYVNPDCALQIFVDYIRKELQIDPTEELDFCTINGDLLHIEDSEPATNATLLFEPFEKYICVLKHRNEEGVIAKITPYVTNTYSDISLKLRRHVRMSKRLSYELKMRLTKENEIIAPTIVTTFSTNRLRLRRKKKA